nr:MULTISPECIES: polysaccharide biosynthesis/export family protein [Paraburkholderia]
MLALCTTLGACAIVPGMRMETSAHRAGDEVSSGAAAQADASSAALPPIPIRDVTPALVQELIASESVGSSRPTRMESGPRAYTLGPGDVLQITVWDHPEFAAAAGPQTGAVARPSDAPAGFVVDQNGKLQFPYVGQMPVEGLRPDQVQLQLTRALSKLFQSPQVTVRVASYRSKQIYIEGEVRNPGTQQVNDVPMTLYEAVSRAGGFLDSADQSRVTLVRDGITESFNLADSRAQNSLGGGIILKSGDRVHIGARDDSAVFVMGEVNKPTTALPRRNGTLTLSEALAQAGSINNGTADAAQLYVIRGARESEPEVFHLDARSPVAMLLANQFPLRANDVVYVDGNGLVRFSRVLNLLLPVINASVAAAVVAK